MKAVLILAALVMASFAHAADTKVGFVDMQKAIQATSAGKKAKTELEAEFEKRKKELQKKEGDLKKMGEDLEKKRAVLSDEVLGKKQAEFQEEMMKYRDSMQKNQAELQKKERDLTQPILEKMKKSIAKVAKDKGFSMVLENNALVLYSEGSNDLTDEVVKAFESDK